MTSTIFSSASTLEGEAGDREPSSPEETSTTSNSRPRTSLSEPDTCSASSDDLNCERWDDWREGVARSRGLGPEREAGE
ncbi:hypothetical protein PC116_g11024 [Phytophthora cactorum]|uniref:Uncharacterized protein n=1 Tax=Phytophthora cactorum TaxID=29920 RepID=A0A8T1DZ93_9STRA|nr:hypothetical protein Pcac1_g2505 [Phytophthora cactorum]KAG2946530.1 hypothetical protein PC117_g7548 [Phytophthora cactorum]KAG4241033.1 hypothetical protein PC116_g11024 [Phytophthora cactorum]